MNKVLLGLLISMTGAFAQAGHDYTECSSADGSIRVEQYFNQVTRITKTDNEGEVYKYDLDNTDYALTLLTVLDSQKTCCPSSMCGGSGVESWTTSSTVKLTVGDPSTIDYFSGYLVCHNDGAHQGCTSSSN